MKITNMRKVDSKSIKAFFDVDFDKFIIKGCKLFQQEGQRFWASPPDEKYEKDGKTLYKKVVEFTDKEYWAKVEAAAISAYDPEPF